MNKIKAISEKNVELTANCNTNLTSDESENFVLELLRKPAGIDVLGQLANIDPFTLSKPRRIDYLAALEKQTGWLQALMQNAIVAVAGDQPSEAESMWSGVDDAEREEVASALRLSPNTAQIRIDVARTLTNHLPSTCSALATGEISAAHATVIAKESAEIINRGAPKSVIKELEEKAIAHAEFHTPSQVANKVRATIAKLAPAEFEDAVAIARDARKVSLFPESDGMCTLVAFLPAQDAQTIMLAIDKLARIDSKNSGSIDENSKSQKLNSLNKDPRSIDMKRADALTQLASAYLSDSLNKNFKHRRPVTVNLTIDLLTLLGLAENPGQIAGYGAIPASVARELAADGKWRRFITDPISGNLIDYGRQSYEPPQDLKDFLIARDQTCRFPGCRQSARRSDIDHAKAWDDGGKTSAENLGVLCRRHHQMKTHGGWKLTSNSDGSCEWISPLGRKYFVPPRPVNEVA
ncbi:MAG: HNH endonuclease [Actinobacteria bacterium]|nr:HNH endonuclease [Actinomycetota bacterium]